RSAAPHLTRPTHPRFPRREVLPRSVMVRPDRLLHQVGRKSIFSQDLRRCQEQMTGAVGGGEKCARAGVTTWPVGRRIGPEKAVRKRGVRRWVVGAAPWVWERGTQKETGAVVGRRWSPS